VSGTPSSAVVAAVLALALAALGTGTASADPGDIGILGPSYGDLGGSATGTKPESKLWFNDGIWWADMYDAATSRHRIHRLDRSAQTWSDAGTTLDTRRASRSDVLWHAASGKLYVASHATTTSGSAASSSQAGKLWRYSYSSVTKTYSLDAGFPVDVNGATSETLVIDKDSTGRLWATWTQDSRVYVSHSNGTDTAWATPFQLPGSTAVDSDDISSLIAFDGKIGVLWSNQSDGHMHFAVHQDGAPDSAWTHATIPTGESPDDHINMKATAAGEVFVATKTSESADDAPLTLLLKRSAGGTWTTTTFGRGSDSHTRPIVVLEEAAGRVRMYATCPQPPDPTGQSGGDICEKTTSMANPSFGSGIGTPVMRDEGTPKMNDATASKHNVTAASGNVILAANATTDRYWYADSAGSGGGGGPTAAFTATPTAGSAPLDVSFADASTGSPTSWSWSFGDGGTSTARNPGHRYAAAGTYTVALTVGDGAGRTDAEVKTGLITVGAGSQPPPPEPPPAGGGGSQQGTQGPAGDGEESEATAADRKASRVLRRTATLRLGAGVRLVALPPAARRGGGVRLGLARNGRRFSLAGGVELRRGGHRIRLRALLLRTVPGGRLTVRLHGRRVALWTVDRRASRLRRGRTGVLVGTVALRLTRHGARVLDRALGTAKLRGGRRFGTLGLAATFR
jgi:PKD repeat protein